MNYFDMLLARNLSGGGGGGGGSLPPFKAQIFDGQITTAVSIEIPQPHSENAFFLEAFTNMDIEIDGVTYANVPCRFDPENPFFAWTWGAGEDEHGNIDFSVYPFQYACLYQQDPVFYTQTAGTYNVKVTAVLPLTSATVSIVNPFESDGWLSSQTDYRIQGSILAESTTVFNFPLVGGCSLYNELSFDDSFEASVSGDAYWDDQNYVLHIFGDATVTITPA